MVITIFFQKKVKMPGFEPVTAWLWIRCAIHCATGPRRIWAKNFLEWTILKKVSRWPIFPPFFQRKCVYIFFNCEKPKISQKAPAWLELSRNLIEIFAFMVQRAARTCSPTFTPLKEGHFTLWIYLNLSFDHKINDFKYQINGVNTI